MRTASGRQGPEDQRLQDGASREPRSPADACRHALTGGSTVRVRVEGSSMAPEIVDGDVVEVAALGERAPEPGEVVLVGLGGGPVVVHRLVARRARGDGWIAVTRGDATRRLDRVLDARDLLGGVTAIRRADETLEPRRIPPGPLAHVRAAWRLSVHGRLPPNHILCVLARRMARGLGWLRRALRLCTHGAAPQDSDASATLCGLDRPADTGD